MDTSKPRGFATRAIHAGERPDPVTGALELDITMATTFVYPSAEEGAAVFAGEKEGYAYTRFGNPTVSILLLIDKQLHILYNPFLMAACKEARPAAQR